MREINPGKKYTRRTSPIKNPYKVFAQKHQFNDKFDQDIRKEIQVYQAKKNVATKVTAQPQELAGEPHSSNKEDEIERLLREQSELQERVSKNEELKRRIAGFKEENRELRVQLEESVNERTQMRKELEDLAMETLSHEEKVYKSNLISVDVLKQFKDAEAEIKTLKQFIVNLKNKLAIYSPVKDDQLDERLANYLNNYPDRKKLMMPDGQLMFVREMEGVYKSGIMIVSISEDQGQLVVRRGYKQPMPIGEFIDKMAQVAKELADRERR